MRESMDIYEYICMRLWIYENKNVGGRGSEYRYQNQRNIIKYERWKYEIQEKRWNWTNQWLFIWDKWKYLNIHGFEGQFSILRTVNFSSLMWSFVSPTGKDWPRWPLPERAIPTGCLFPLSPHFTVNAYTSTILIRVLTLVWSDGTASSVISGTEKIVCSCMGFIYIYHTYIYMKCISVYLYIYICESSI